MAAKDLPSQSGNSLFPRLRGGPHGMEAGEVARHQRARLQGAMVEAVARHGFAATTLSELVGLAGVSKTTFYEHYANKQDCFLATFDAIVAEVTDRVSAAYRRPGDFRQRLVTALTAFMDVAVAEPEAAALVTVASLTLGTAGVEHRERASRAFEGMVRRSFDRSPSPVEVSDVVVRAIVAGIRGIVYRHFRSGRQAQLPQLVEPLADWALGYQRPPGEAARRAVAAAEAPARPAAPSPSGGGGEEIPWEESPASARSRALLSQRQRMIRAAAQIVVEGGYESLSIPAISHAAGVSNQAFYEYFKSESEAGGRSDVEGKREVLLAAFEVVAADVVGVVGNAFAAEGDRPEAIGAAARALTEYFAARELFARLSFFELPTAGPEALDRADRVLDGFGAFLAPGTIPSAFAGALPDAILPAVTSGVWAAIQHEIAHGRRQRLPEIAPEIARIAIGPLSDA